MNARRVIRPPARQLRRHPLCLVPPFLSGVLLLGAGVLLVAVVPDLIASQAFRLAFVAVELFVFLRCWLLPLITWRIFRLFITEERIDVVEFKHWGLAIHQHSLFGVTTSTHQRLWEIPLKTGTLTLQNGASMVRYTLLTPIGW